MSTDLERIPYWTRQAARQRLTRRRFLGSTAAAGAGLAGAALIGCGGGDGGDGGGGGSDTRGAVTPVPNTSGGAAVGTPTAVAGGGAAQRGGTLRIAGQLTGDVPSLDYDRTNASAMGSIWNLAGAKLTQWDERPDSPGPVEAVIPDLAESWESPDEGLTWTFRLRQDAQTSDGLPVTAEDVVWSFQRQGEIRTPLGLLEANLRDMYPEGQPSATAIDDYTVQIKLLNPDADFLALMGSHWWSVTHESVITKDGSAPGETAPGWGDVTGVDQIRGGGPYYPTEYVPASGFKLARNPNFYDPEIAYFDEIDHPLIVDTTAAAAALQAEQLDAFGPLTQFTVQQGMELEQSENLQVDWQPCMVWNPWIFD
ncbi:MAG: ABC transporter substrate-binding protein, partial [Dehalococcoidia bacterium]